MSHPLIAANVNVTEDNFVSAEKCIQNIKRQLVTTSSHQRVHCCVSHLHHEQAMKASYRVRQFFTVLQHIHHFKIDVIAKDATAPTYKYYKKQDQDLYNSSIAVMLREMQRKGFQFEHRRHNDCCTNCHFLNVVQEVVLMFVPWLFSHGTTTGPRIMRKL